MGYRLWQYLNLWSVAAVLYGKKMDGKTGNGLLGDDPCVNNSRLFISRHFGVDMDDKETYNNRIKEGFGFCYGI